MPAIAAVDLARLRFTKHATLLRLAVYTPAAIWTAQVDGLQTTGDTTITVKNVVPTARTPAQHYQVLIGSTAGGREYGEARYEDYGAPTLTVGAHNCELPDNAYITVMEEIKPCGIAATIDATDVVTENGGLRPYTDENLNFEPLARCGPPAVAYRDETTGIATVKFYGNPVPALGTGAGITITDHAWDFVDGNPAASAIQGTSAVPISVEYATSGERYISYWVQDSNGKTHSTRRPVFIFDRYSGTLPYTQIEVSGMEGDVEAGGWRCDLAVHTDAGVDAFPPQALCVVFAEDWFGSEKVSIGGHYTYRENIVMVGYIRRGTTRKDWARGVVEFELEGIGRVMDNIPGVAMSLEASAAPIGWHELDNLCPAMAAFHLITEHSTIDHICDIHLTPVLYEMDFVDVTETSLHQQLSQEIAPAARGRVGSNAQGMLYFETNPQLLPLASRTNPVVLSTNFVDFRGEITFDTEESEKQVALVDFCSQDADGDPIFSLAPPYPWSMGRLERVDGLRADTQAESNILSGLYEGYLNNQYANVPVNWRGNYRVFDVFPSEAVNLNITAAQNKRGISWTEQRFWTKRVTYEYRNSNLLVSTVIEKDAYGSPGKTGEYPEEPPIITPPEPPVEPPPVDPPDPPPVVTPGDGSRVYVGTNAGVAVCSNFLTAPTWTALNTGLAGTALNVYRFYFDPWSSNGTALNGAYIATQDGIYKNTNLTGGGAWAQVLSGAQVLAAIGGGTTVATFHRWIVLPINIEDFVGVWAAAGDGSEYDAYYWFYSSDGGATWSVNTRHWIMGHTFATGVTWGEFYFQVFPSHKTAGTFYAVISTGTWWTISTAERWTVFKTTDRGVNWAKLKYWDYSGSSPYRAILSFANGAAVPYASDTRAWRLRSELIEYTNAWPGAAELPTNDWTLSYTAATEFRDFDMCTWDEDYIYAIRNAATAQVVYTNNGGVAWSTYNLASNFYRPICLSCLPGNALFCAVGGTDEQPLPDDPLILLTVNGGAAWSDQTGNLATVLASATQVNSIVPDWIKIA